MLNIYRQSIAVIGMIIMGIITSLIRYLSFGYGVKLNRAFIAPFFAGMILSLMGVRVKTDITKDKQCCSYFFNHNSYLDLFLIPYISLPNTRFIITEGVKKIIPLHLCNLGVDVLYIPDSHKTDERIAFFKQVSNDIKNNKYSVICSPEGRHDFISGIAPFNKGVFHMAISSGRPIHNLFFEVYTSGSPNEMKHIMGGKIIISTLNIMQTTDMSLDQLGAMMKTTRSLFLEKYKKVHGDYGESKLES